MLPSPRRGLQPRRERTCGSLVDIPPRKPSASPNGSHARRYQPSPGRSPSTPPPLLARASGTRPSTAPARSRCGVEPTLTASFDPPPPPPQALASSSMPSARTPRSRSVLPSYVFAPSAIAGLAPRRRATKRSPASRPWRRPRAAGARPQLLGELRRDRREQPHEDPQRDDHRLAVSDGELLAAPSGAARRPRCARRGASGSG